MRLALSLVLLLTACSPSPMPAPDPALPTVRTHPWHDTRHHTGGGFRNVWDDDDDEPPFLKAAAWGVSFLLASKEQEPAPLQKLDGLAPADGPRLTWLGHSTVLIELDGLTVLTDPVFAERASPVPFAGPKREVALPIAPDALPPIDLVLLSHDHYDHLDLDAIATLHERDRPLVLAPLGVGARLGEARVLEMDWWQHVEVGGFRIHAAPAKHFSGRTLWDRDRTLWASWYLEPMGGGAPSVYYAGDTAYAPHFADVRERLGARARPPRGRAGPALHLIFAWSLPGGSHRGTVGVTTTRAQGGAPGRTAPYPPARSPLSRGRAAPAFTLSK